MDINTFISENYVGIIVVAVILVMTIIGYVAQKTEFGKKVSERNKKTNEINSDNKNEEIEILNENSSDDSNIFSSNDSEQLDVLDTIAPDFNDGGLVVGDVNQNPNKTNEDLGIPEDLYAPFGDENIKPETSIEDLKIEDVAETDDFNIVEKENVENSVDELFIQDINQSLASNNNFDVEELKIEDVQNSEMQSVEQNQSNSYNPVVEEINNLVDNTFVINDGTDDFEGSNLAQDNSVDKVEIENQKEESKVVNFDIEENAMSIEEPNDLEIEATTNLKLDEINEKIKNLKLEDLDNPNLDEELINDLKEDKKKKQISVKSIDEIKKAPKLKKAQNVVELDLPSLDIVNDNDKEIDEADDTWNF